MREVCTGSPSTTLSVDGAAIGNVVGFSVHERISAPFRDVVAVEVGPGVALEGLLGSPATLSYTRSQRTTAFSGVVSRVALTAERDGHAVYAVELAPTLAALELSKTLRTFQGKHKRDIVRSVLETAGVPFELRLAGPAPRPIDFVLQGGETDFAFASRVLEEEGSHYHFVPGDPAGTVVIGNTNAAFEALSGFAYYGHMEEAPTPDEEYFTTLAFETVLASDSAVVHG